MAAEGALHSHSGGSTRRAGLALCLRRRWWRGDPAPGPEPSGVGVRGGQGEVADEGGSDGSGAESILCRAATPHQNRRDFPIRSDQAELGVNL